MEKETKTILVLCGAGFATSTVGAKTCEDICKELGFKPNVQKRNATAGKTAVAQLKPDMILQMTKLTLDFGDVPVVDGVPFITGRGKEETKEKIRQILKKQA